MAARLDTAYLVTAARLPGNASVRIETALDGTATLSLTALDKLEEPASLVSLRAALAARMRWASTWPSGPAALNVLAHY